MTSLMSFSKSRMKVSYPELFPSGKFSRTKILLGGRVVTARFTLVCDYPEVFHVFIYACV